MQESVKERVRQLCEQAAIEQDPKKLRKLIEEITRLLDPDKLRESRRQN